MANESDDVFFKKRAGGRRSALWRGGSVLEIAPTAAATQRGKAIGGLKRRPKNATVTFGSVKIKGQAPAPEEVTRNIASGQSALLRAKKAFINPGVKLSRSKDIPLYHADPEDPRILIRELNGASERVTFVDGKFKRAE